MLKKLFAREDKTADRGQVEERGYNPMPAGWKPPARLPVHQAGRPPHLRRPADADRPQSPPPADSGE